MSRWLSIILVGALLPLASAKVYWRTKSDVPQGWKRAYHANVELNNGKGTVSMYGTIENTMQEALKILVEMHGEKGHFSSDEEMAWGFAIEDGILYRYLLQLGEGDMILITCIQQNAKKVGKPGQLPHQHQLKKVPTAAGSFPTYYMKDQHTQMATEISASYQSPSSVMETLGDELLSKGWLETLPPGEDEDHAMRWFIKRNEMILISARRTDDGATRILRVHKPLGVEE